MVQPNSFNWVSTFSLVQTLSLTLSKAILLTCATHTGHLYPPSDNRDFHWTVTGHFPFSKCNDALIRWKQEAEKWGHAASCLAQWCFHCLNHNDFPSPGLMHSMALNS